MNKLGTRRGPYRNRHPAADAIDDMAVQGIPWRDIWQSLVKKHTGLTLQYVKSRATQARTNARRRGELEPITFGSKTYVNAFQAAGFKLGGLASTLKESPIDFVKWVYDQTNGGRLTVSDALIQIARREYERQAGTPTGTM